MGGVGAGLCYGESTFQGPSPLGESAPVCLRGAWDLPEALISCFQGDLCPGEHGSDFCFKMVTKICLTPRERTMFGSGDLAAKVTGRDWKAVATMTHGLIRESYRHLGL